MSPKKDDVVDFVDYTFPPSTLTQARLDGLREAFKIPHDIRVRVPTNSEKPNSILPPNCICIFLTSLLCGLRLPFSDSLRAFLEFTCLIPARLSPNSFSIFNAVTYLLDNVDLSASLENLSGLVTISKLDGFYCLRSRSSKLLSIVGAPSSHKNYKSQYFIAEKEGGWGRLSPFNARITPENFRLLVPGPTFITSMKKQFFKINIKNPLKPEFTTSTFHFISEEPRAASKKRKAIIRGDSEESAEEESEREAEKETGHSDPGSPDHPDLQGAMVVRQPSPTVIPRKKIQRKTKARAEINPPPSINPVQEETGQKQPSEIVSLGKYP